MICLFYANAFRFKKFEYKNILLKLCLCARNKIITIFLFISWKSSEQTNVYENEITQDNMFKIDYFTRWIFFLVGIPRVAAFYSLRSKFLKLNNF